jgi:hypothetical protein
VRQLFESGVVQSGFWHQFAMTAHSPVGMNPELFKVKRVSEIAGAFANNDLEHIDPVGNHERFSAGLKKSLFNYMHGICFEFPLQDWFDFKVPQPKVAPDYIEFALNNDPERAGKPSSKVVWLGAVATVETQQRNKKGRSFTTSHIIISNKREDVKVRMEVKEAEWLATWLPKLKPDGEKTFLLSELKKDFEQNDIGDFEAFFQSPEMDEIRNIGLLIL